MGPTVESLRIQNFEARLGLHQFVSETLELELEAATTNIERADITLRRDQVMREYDSVLRELEILKSGREFGPLQPAPAN